MFIVPEDLVATCNRWPKTYISLMSQGVEGIAQYVKNQKKECGLPRTDLVIMRMGMEKCTNAQACNFSLPFDTGTTNGNS